MASKIASDSLEGVSTQVDLCLKHSGSFVLEYFCEECKTAVCFRCLALEHQDHEFIHLKLKTPEEWGEIELREKLKELEKRKTVVQAMKRSCREMSQGSHEIADEKLLSIEHETEYKRQRVELQRNDFDRRISSMTERLEKEENELYVLEYSSQTILSSRENVGNESCLEDIKEKLDRRICSKIPRVKTFNDLQDRFKKITSSNQLSSSETWIEEGGSCISSFTVCSPSPTHPNVELGSGEGKEYAKGCTDDIVLCDLAKQILPEQFTTLGLRLHVSHVTLQQVRDNNSRDIAEAIYQVLQEWKRTVSSKVLTVNHFEELEQCLRAIGQSDAADWLIERLQMSKGHIVQPPPSPDPLGLHSPSQGKLMQPPPSPDPLGLPSPSQGKLMHPSSSPDPLGLPSPSPDQLEQPSPSSCHLVQPSSSPGQLVQPSSSLDEIVQLSSSPGQILQPFLSPDPLVQPSSSHVQCVQPSTSDYVQPPSSDSQ